jgi:small GTP-binding protein
MSENDILAVFSELATFSRQQVSIMTNHFNMSNVVKLVIVGDGAVGKTCLLVVYAQGSFPTEYIPTIFENYHCKVNVADSEYNVQLWDTAGQEGLEAVRTLSYPNTNVFLMCFSIGDRTTYENVKHMWVPEIRQYAKNPVFLLVGTKADLRATTESAITTEEGRGLAKHMGAFNYIECSAIKCEAVKDVFDAAIVQAINPPTRGGCCSVQ